MLSKATQLLVTNFLLVYGIYCTLKTLMSALGILITPWKEAEPKALNHFIKSITFGIRFALTYINFPSFMLHVSNSPATLKYLLPVLPPL